METSHFVAIISLAVALAALRRLVRDDFGPFHGVLLFLASWAGLSVFALAAIYSFAPGLMIRQGAC